MPFLPPNQQRQSTEGKALTVYKDRIFHKITIATSQRNKAKCFNYFVSQAFQFSISDVVTVKILQQLTEGSIIYLNMTVIH